MTARKELALLRESNLSIVSKLKYLFVRLTITSRLKPLFRNRQNAISLRVLPLGDVWLRLATSDLLVFREVFLLREYNELLERLRINRPELITHVIDLGANVGLASRLLSASFPNASFTCVEPEPGNFKALTRNLAGMPSADLLNVAVSTENGTANLQMDPFEEWGGRVSSEISSTGHNCRVELRAIKEIVGKRTNGTQRLLKIDIEGGERELFQAANTWAHAVDFIMVEIHDPYTEAEFENDVKKMPCWQIAVRTDRLFALEFVGSAEKG
jgi:FkbM family methyltransferase